MALTPLKQRIPIDMGLLEILNQRFQQVANDPVVLINGNVWYNTTQHRLKRVENGVIVPFFSKVDADKLASFESAVNQAQADADAAQAEIDLIVSDNILYRSEKPVIRSQYNLLIAEQIAINEIATLYGITIEKTNYNNAITALTSYLNSLNPLYTDYTRDTVIDGALFRQLFSDVYSTRQLLSNAMSAYAHNIMDEALSIANIAKLAADAAQYTATTAMESITAVADDGLLARQEKPGVTQQYNVILGEYAGIDVQAADYSIVTERTNYTNAKNALVIYMESLNPTYNDYTQDTVIVRADFNTIFETYYNTKQSLLNAIYETARLLADDASIIARSKGRHFISQPTTPYSVGDLYSNTNDLYRCIVARLVGAYNPADWELATHYDRTKTIIDGGLITTGRIEVGSGTTIGQANAGMNGSVGVVTETDIRFWAGADYANKIYAPWRVQDNGEFWSTKGHIGGWTIDNNSMYSGTKVAGNGFSAAPGDLTINSDGSIHAYKFYINTDGTVSFKATGAEVSTTPRGSGDLDGDVSTVVANGGSVADIVECTLVSGSSGSCEITIDGQVHSAYWNTSLETTASDFLSQFATSYSGIVVTRSLAKLIFTKAGGSISSFYAANNGIMAMPSSGVHTQYYSAGTAQKDKITLNGTWGTCSVVCNAAAGIVYYNYATLSGNSLDLSASDFVTIEASHFLTHGIIVTSVGNEIFLESTTRGVVLTTISTNIPTGTVGSLTMISNHIFEASENSNQGSILINMRGYNGGTKWSRNTYIGNGRGGTLLKIDGYFNLITATVPVLGSPGTFYTGSIYYDSGVLKMF